MGQLDNKYLSDVAPRVEGSGNAPKHWREIVSGDPSVTSRDDIINPYAVVNPRDYALTRKGRMQYESDLARVIEFQKQQQASYEEWYNSPEQAAIRERAAGMNPDLVGLDSAGEASQVTPSDAVPGENLPTNGELALNAINTAVSVMQTIGSLSVLPLQFQALSKSNQLVDKQIEGQKLTNDALSLGNVSAFEKLAHRAISDKYATYHSGQLKSGLTPDIAAFFADDANFEDIIPSYAPSDNAMYRNALNRVRKGSESIIADAYSISNDKVTNQSSLARLLSNPWFDDDTKLMAANLSPLMDAIFQLEESTALFNKQVIDFKSSYVGELDSETLANNYELQSNYQRMMANHQAIIEGAKSYVYTNLKTLYETDPLSPAGFRAGCLIMGQAPNSIGDFLTQYLANLLSTENANGFDWLTNPTGTPGLDGPGAGFIPPGSPRFKP